MNGLDNRGTLRAAPDAWFPLEKAISTQISFQFAFFDPGCNNYPAMLLSERTRPGGRIKLLPKQTVGLSGKRPDKSRFLGIKAFCATKVWFFGWSELTLPSCMNR